MRTNRIDRTNRRDAFTREKTVIRQANGRTGRRQVVGSLCVGCNEPITDPNDAVRVGATRVRARHGACESPPRYAKYEADP